MEKIVGHVLHDEARQGSEADDAERGRGRRAEQAAVMERERNE